MRSLIKRLEDLESFKKEVRYIVTHSEEEATAYHRWAETQPAFYGVTYVLLSNIPPFEDSPLPPWLEGVTQ